MNVEQTARVALLDRAQRSANHFNEYWSRFSQKKCALVSASGCPLSPRRTMLSRMLAKGVTPMPAPIKTAYFDANRWALGEP